MTHPLSTILLLLCVISSIAHAEPQYGIAMHGDLKYPKNLTHFADVNPNAPKGGTLRLATSGGFDSMNPFILKGNPAPGLNAMGQGLLYESLMTQSDDEPFSMYGLIADTIDVARDRLSVTFHINKNARWHDGTPITADDVKWTFDKMMSEGAPFFKAYFADVKDVTVDDPARVTFHFNTADNRELPLVIAQMVVLPKHYYEETVIPETPKALSGTFTNSHNLQKVPDRPTGVRDDTHPTFSGTTLTPPLGSGPYKIGAIKPGDQIEYVRADNWWGRDLAVNKGRYNFDRITFESYRDENVALEAFFGGRYDVRSENVAKLWAAAYNVPAVTDGRITRAEIPHSNPVGMQGFIFNTRRPVFADINVRRAIAMAFDFEWANKKLAGGVYQRNASFFENSELAARGLPTAAELKILEPFRGKIPDAVFTDPFIPPTTDGSGNARENLRTAADILEKAGYILGKDGVRANAAGVKLQFTFIEANPALERWILPFLQNLKKIGVVVTLRTIDPTQYQNRMQNFDFDMTTSVMGQSDSPGNEQRDFWTSVKADQPGSRNLIGVKDPVVDALVDQIINAPTRADLVARTRALDRVLLHSHYVIPNWHYAKWRVAWWKGFNAPKDVISKSLGVMDKWWYEKK